MPAIRLGVKVAFDEIDRIDRLMSHYKPNSELSRVNREAANSPIEVEPELFDFIVECLHFSHESDGAFDITVGPLMKAWGFFRGEGRMPTDAELAEARSCVGFQHVILNRKEKSIFFDKAGVELDLGGIAKGYAVDRAIEVLKKYGFSAALVSAGGSTISTFGTPPGKAAWDVEIQDPTDQRKIAMSIPLKNQTLSVSGGYEKFFGVGSTRYSHIMDPRTGQPVQGVLSVAVISNDGMSSDALDNVFYVLGMEKSQQRLRYWPGAKVFFFLPEPGKRWRLVQLPGGRAIGESK
jgi:thiamine biosynthesis lipoprotein